MTALLLSVALLAEPAPDRGAQLFTERCVVCHGAKGDGAGVTAAALKPPPADLTAARFTSPHVEHVLLEGVCGTGMPPQTDLSTTDRAALVAYVRALGPAKAPAIDAALAKEGAAVYAIRCAVCHGENGEGDGPAASRVGRPPAKFTEKQATREHIVRVLERGIAGTAMTPMRRLLTAREVDALVHFLQSRYREPATEKAAR